MADSRLHAASTAFATTIGLQGGVVDVRGPSPTTAPPLPVTTAAGDPNFSILDAIIKGGIGFVTGGVPGAAAGFGEGFFGPTDSPIAQPGAFGGMGATCPDGSFPIAGRCVDPLAFIPGGDPLVSTRTGVAVMGAFGIPAMTPAVVGQINGRPIRRCPSGAVLGKDELCYMKGSIPRQFRKWAPAPKPPMSAADAKALRRIGTLQKKVKKLASNANLSCKRK